MDPETASAISKFIGGSNGQNPPDLSNKNQSGAWGRSGDITQGPFQTGDFVFGGSKSNVTTIELALILAAVIFIIPLLVRK